MVKAQNVVAWFATPIIVPVPVSRASFGSGELFGQIEADIRLRRHGGRLPTERGIPLHGSVLKGLREVSELVGVPYDLQ